MLTDNMRLALVALCLAGLIACGVTLYLRTHAAASPIVISGPSETLAPSGSMPSGPVAAGQSVASGMADLAGTSASAAGTVSGSASLSDASVDAPTSSASGAPPDARSVSGALPDAPSPSAAISGPSGPDAYPASSIAHEPRSASTSPGDPAAPASPARSRYLAVHVAAAVKRPGLYWLRPGSRIADAIHAAGGPRRDADLDAVNLAEMLADAEKVYVPWKSASPAPERPSVPSRLPRTGRTPRPAYGNTIGRVSIVPLNPVGLGVQIPSVPPLPGLSDAGLPRGFRPSMGASGKLVQGSGERVNINAASPEDLQRLPGVGPAMARRILAYRIESGGFGSIDQLREVKGIGAKKFARIAPLVTLR
jgi:competence protein ComEA